MKKKTEEHIEAMVEGIGAGITISVIIFLFWIICEILTRLLSPYPSFFRWLTR